MVGIHLPYNVLYVSQTTYAYRYIVLCKASCQALVHAHMHDHALRETQLAVSSVNITLGHLCGLG